ncbi:MAG: hypothetical protein AAGL24_24880 [Pseudomonadota bacterium]
MPERPFNSELFVELENKRLELLHRLQRQPFVKLSKELSNIEEKIGLVFLEVHLCRLTSLFARIESSTYDEIWNGCYSNLHTAASIKGIDVNTDINDDSAWCGAASDYESAKSDVVGSFIAGRLTFEMVFHAYEVLGQSYCGQLKSVTAQQISRKLIVHEDYRPLLGFSHIVNEAIRLSPQGFNLKTQDAHHAIAQGSWIGLGAENLRQFRNALVHGRLQAPEPLDWGKDAKDSTASDQSEIFRSQIRLCLMLIQIMCCRLAGSLTVDAPDQLFTVDDVVFKLHLEDADDYEEDIEELSLDGIRAPPSFLYW